MPYGTGTYGSTRGKPPGKKKKATKPMVKPKPKKMK